MLVALLASLTLSYCPLVCLHDHSGGFFFWTHFRLSLPEIHHVVKVQHTPNAHAYVAVIYNIMHTPTPTPTTPTDFSILQE